MKLCVPTTGEDGLTETVSDHFGRAPAYTFYDTETDAVDAMPNESKHMGGSGMPPDVVASAGADVLLCHNLGKPALSMLQERGVTVYTGVGGTVGDVIEQWRAGALEEATMADAGGHHDHDHDHDH